MADRIAQKIESDIVERYGMLVNIKQAAEIIGYSNRNSAKNFLHGIPCCVMGKDKKYLASDIAKRISASMIVE